MCKWEYREGNGSEDGELSYVDDDYHCILWQTTIDGQSGQISISISIGKENKRKRKRENKGYERQLHQPNHHRPNKPSRKNNPRGKEVTPVETNIEMHKCPEEPRRRTRNNPLSINPRNIPTKNRMRKLHQPLRPTYSVTCSHPTSNAISTSSSEFIDI